MKKTIKRITLAITIVLALIGATGTVALASGYITWGGTQDFEQTLINLNLISERGQELKKDNGELEKSNGELKASNENISSELEQTRNKLLDKDNQIKDKENEIDSLNQQIEALKKRIEGGQTSQDQLRQAEIDMKDVRIKSEEVLSSFN